MAKRTSLKGKGADIFLGSDEKKPESHTAIKTESNNAGTPAGQNKVTYYISNRIIDEFEDLWLSLRKKYRKRKVSKSEIVEFALEGVIEDWEKNQEKSKLETGLISK